MLLLKNIKNRLLLIVLLFALMETNGQTSSEISSSSQAYDETISTVNNITTLNLFNINYNGETIPINIVYDHKGIQVDQLPSVLGYGWELKNIGVIQSIINDYKDSKPTSGWFNSLHPNYSSYSYYGDNPQLGRDKDYSPDFFLARIFNGRSFDFCYKKNISGTTIGTPIPVFLSNDNGYKINTNFTNFINIPSDINNQVVFSVLDNSGNVFDFVNGPFEEDYFVSNSSIIKNDYYLKSIKNSSNSDFVEIEYFTKNLFKLKQRYLGLNYYNSTLPATSQINQDFNNNIINNLETEYVNTIDESESCMKKITTNELIIEFKYPVDISNHLDGGYLQEILVYDKNQNFINGFRFEYDVMTLVAVPLLVKILKYNNDRSQSQILYSFDYFQGQEFMNQNGQLGDFFGFNNAQFKENFMAFPVRVDINNVRPAGNYYPNVDTAKQFSLSKIINKYGGSTEFDYQLKYENHNYWGELYGGGLVIKSEKSTPLTGKAKFKNYVYENLVGYNLQLHPSAIAFQFFRTISNSIKHSSTIFALDETYSSGQGGPAYCETHTSGNYFEKITEELYDSDSMELQSKTIMEYCPNTEGVYRTPLIKKVLVMDNNYSTIKQTDYLYTFDAVESINRATYGISTRSYYTLVSKINRPISVNRTKLSTVVEKLWNNGEIVKNSAYEYTSPSSKRLRSVSSTDSFGVNNKSTYYYADDSQMQSEPFVNDLKNKNIIGKPLLTENYKGSEKLFSNKVEFKNWGNNILSPEILKASKGANPFEYTSKVTLVDNLTGNPLEIKQEGGVSVCFIWGYNNNQIIAKIENCSYSTIPSNLITDVQTKSNSGSESTLLSALDDLRNHSSLANSFVTTYTYIPLVGISSQTSPTGDKITFHYDDYKNLQFVKDAQDNILTEKEYHLKSQN